MSLEEGMTPKLAGRLGSMQRSDMIVFWTEMGAVPSAVRLDHLRNSLSRHQFNSL
jgi:hypothetical protein